MTDDPNRRIGDYEVLGVLGSGGMGKVFKVRNVISDRIEAMKVLLPDLAGRQELADRFLREIKLLASLDHPNIAQLRTALTLSNRLVMVMEYVEGTTLAARLEQGPIPPAEAVGYISQVLNALAYAHARNVIHRDIKPANMMLTPSGTVKLMDFGIARASGDASMTVTGTTVGSLFYMSPEQVKGTTIDARSDLYSLGVSLYEMVTGERPFKATSDYSIMTAQLQERPKPPSELRPELPPQLNGIILHAMAKEPADRFQSADEFRQSLASLGLTAPAAAAGAEAPATSPVPAAATSVITEPTPIPGTMNVPLPPLPAQAMPIPSVMDMSPKPSKGRGLYMALGAALVLVVLVLAGISFPRWMKTRANEQKQADQQKQTDQNASSSQDGSPNSNSTNSNPPPSDNSGSSNAKPEDSGANASSGNSTPSDSGSTTKSGDSGTSDNSASANGSTGTNDSGKAKSSSEKKQAKSKGTGKGSGNSSGDQGSTTANTADQANSSADSASKAELEELEQDVDQTSSRSNAVGDSLDNMRRSLSSQGLNLRGDIASSQELMKTSLDKAQQALQNHDAKNARKYLTVAQSQLEKIEKFLGH